MIPVNRSIVQPVKLQPDLQSGCNFTGRLQICRNENERKPGTKKRVRVYLPVLFDYSSDIPYIYGLKGNRKTWYM